MEPRGPTCPRRSARREVVVQPWCHRLNFFVAIWEENDLDPDFDFTDDVASIYRETQALLDRSAGVGAGSAFGTRLKQLRLQTPRGEAIAHATG